MVKNPFKPNYLPFFTLGAGITGLLLRIWLYGSGIDHKGLFVTEHPANTLLFVLTGVTLLIMVLFVMPLNRAPAYNKLFPPSILSFVGCLIGGAGILAVNLFNLSGGSDPFTTMSMVLGILATASLLYVGFCRYRGIHPGILFRTVITVYFMLHLVCQYRQWSAEPQLQAYFFPLLASIFLMLTSYQRTTMDAGQGVRRWYVFTNQAALFFCLVSTVGQHGVLYLAMGLWLFTELCSLQKVRSFDTKPTGMYLPTPVRYCIDMLEAAGYRAYAVGGCVRDSLLELSPQDHDLCTNAAPSVIAEIFSEHKLVRSGEQHGTIGVVIEHEVFEITTFRTEGGYSDSRHPDWVEFVPTVQEDLARRDFTVNAMAYSPKDGYIDPWGGRQDLQNRILRAVGDPAERFREDPLRILRGVRFAVRFGLTPEEHTQNAMFSLAPLLDNLARERVFDELSKLLPLVKTADLLRFGPILAQAIPDLGPCIGFAQYSPHHSYDVFTHTAHVVGSVEPEPALRWAALLHDVAKPVVFTMDEEGRGHFKGHAQVGAEIANDILLGLKAPNALREQVIFLIRHHMTPFEADKKLLLRRLGKYGKKNCKQLLALQRADFCSKGTDGDTAYFDQVQELLTQIEQENSCLTTRDLTVNGQDLLDLGFEAGPKIGKALKTLLECVQDEILHNTKEELLAAAQRLKD